jgi:hypothetical protein
MKHIHTLIVSVFLASTLMLAATFIQEILVVDSVLDAGASYDFTNGRADFTQNHPYIPFWERNSTLLLVSGLSLFGVMVHPITQLVRKVIKMKANQALNRSPTFLRS